MTEILIRPASPDDTPAIVQFNVALAQESAGLRLDPQTVEAGVRRMFPDPALGRYTLAVSLTGEPLGQLMITTEWSDWRNCMLWWPLPRFTCWWACSMRRLRRYRWNWELFWEAARPPPGGE